MNTYPAGVGLQITIPMTDLNEEPVTALSASARVLDESEEVLDGSLTVEIGGEDAVVTVPAGVNQLAAGVIGGARTIELAIETAEGTFIKSEFYLIQASIRLAVPTNSFQTYTQALLTASTMPAMPGWLMHEPKERQNALMEAYRRITKLGFWIRPSDNPDYMNRIDLGEERHITPDNWDIMTADDYAGLPEHFKKALRFAQLAEADDVLGGDAIGKKRRSGILSETIGESSMMFKAGKALDYGLSGSSAKYLVNYVRIRASIARA